MQQTDIQRLIAENPSLKAHLAETLVVAHEDAREREGSFELDDLMTFDPALGD